MKIALQYVNEINGNARAFQLLLTEGEKVPNKLKKYA